MIITCVCGEKKFTLPDNSIPTSGRMVKCGFSDKEWKQLISLPCHAGMKEEDIDYVIYWVKSYFSSISKI